MTLSFSSDRQAAAQTLSNAYSDRFQITSQELDKRLSDWALYCVMSNGQAIGAVSVKDGEGHIGIIKEFRAKWGGKSALVAMCQHFKVTKTAVACDNLRSMKLLERWGWKRTGQNERGILYELS